MPPKPEKKKSGLISIEETEEMLDLLDKAMERLKTMYEQYFLGVQKQAPGQLHSEVERRIRDIMQIQLRNTVQRYRFATMQQKYGSYNTYWRRTLKQIEKGTYIRQLHKIGRDAVKNGTDIPEEILAAMPKRMRDQVIRDREAALAVIRRRNGGRAATAEELLELDSMIASGEVQLPPGHDEAPMELDEDAFADAIAMIKEPTELRRDLRKVHGRHVVDANDGDMDLDSFFAEVERAPEPDKAVDARAVKRITATPAPAPVTQQGPANVRAAAVAGPQVKAPRLSNATPAGGVPALSPTGAKVEPLPAGAVSQEADAQGFKPLRRGVSRWPIAATQPGVPPAPGTPAPPTMTPLPPKSPLAAQAPASVVLPPKHKPFGGIPAIPAVLPAKTLVGSPAAPGERPSQPMAAQAPGPSERPSQPMAAQQRPSQPSMPAQRPSQSMMAQPAPSERPSQPMVAQQRPSQPSMPAQRPSQPMVAQPPPPSTDINPDTDRTPAPRRHPPTDRNVPEQVVKTPPPQRQQPRPDPPPQRAAPPPPGMSDADVNALYAKYVKAKEMVGENAGPGAYGKLLKTINAQAPKIMEQYKAKGVEFQIVVKDNQVIIRAKPKT